jgi:hypothetical protein
MTQTTAPRIARMLIRAIHVAKIDGTPRRRIRLTTGWMAQARISAIVTGMNTSDSWVMTRMPTATSPRTVSVCRLRVATIPKPRDHSPFSGGGASCGRPKVGNIILHSSTRGRSRQVTLSID